MIGKAYDCEKNEYAYIEVEVQPQFEGGENGLRNFLAKHVKYPLDARNDNRTGRVTIRFAIENDGSISEVTNLSDGYPSLVEEAKRVVNLMNGKWKPGLKRGTSTKVYFILPIVFNLS